LLDSKTKRVNRALWTVFALCPALSKRYPVTLFSLPRSGLELMYSMTAGGTNSKSLVGKSIGSPDGFARLSIHLCTLLHVQTI